MTTEIEIKQKTEIDIRPPSLWKVIFLNDDFTPMEFVISVLMNIYNHSQESSEELTLEIHNSGNAVVGTYTFEIAEQKVLETTSLARNKGHPLEIQLEKEEIL